MIQLEIANFNASGNAVMSDDGIYRYKLERVWSSEKRTVAFICLNPSIADDRIDDPTVKRCISFAKSFGAGRLVIGNLFALRSTDPKGLLDCIDPVGPENDVWLDEIASSADILIAGWGVSGGLKGRDKVVRKRYQDQLHTLRITKDGHPSHPLYLPSKAQLIKY